MAEESQSDFVLILGRSGILPLQERLIASVNDAANRGVKVRASQLDKRTISFTKSCTNCGG